MVRVEIKGKMSEKGADRARFVLVLAALVAAISFGGAALLFFIGILIKQ